MRKKYLFFLALGLLLCSCSLLERKHQEGAVVEVHGHFLYRSTLDSMTLGLNSEDSMRVAQQYIRQWAKDILLYDEAKASADASIEALVEDYRRTLYVHAYEEYLVDRRMPKTILDTTIQQIYDQMPDRFRLDESIMKGVLLVIPIDAPNGKKLRQWLADLSKAEEVTPELMDQIEKYAYQNASGYELFTDKWLTTSDIMAQMPIQRTDLEAQLKQRNQIEVNDSTKTYLLQLTAKCMRAERMPIEYARPEIERIILNERQVEFLNKERERLYDEAIQEKEILFF